MHKSAQLYDNIQNESRLSKATDEKSEESGNAHFDIRETKASCGDQDALLSPSSKPVEKDAEQPMVSASQNWGIFHYQQLIRY